MGWTLFGIVFYVAIIALAIKSFDWGDTIPSFIACVIGWIALTWGILRLSEFVHSFY